MTSREPATGLIARLRRLDRELEEARRVRDVAKFRRAVRGFHYDETKAPAVTVR